MLCGVLEEKNVQSQRFKAVSILGSTDRHDRFYCETEAGSPRMWKPHNVRDPEQVVALLEANGIEAKVVDVELTVVSNDKIAVE